MIQERGEKNSVIVNDEHGGKACREAGSKMKQWAERATGDQ